jgi:hypothetical protein
MPVAAAPPLRRLVHLVHALPETRVRDQLAHVTERILAENRKARPQLDMLLDDARRFARASRGDTASLLGHLDFLYESYRVHGRLPPVRVAAARSPRRHTRLPPYARLPSPRVPRRRVPRTVRV